MITPELQEEGNTIPPLNTREQSRKWCFTLNNWTEDEYLSIKNYIITKGLDYVVGKEVGENGTPHLQGYLSSKNPMMFSRLKKVMPRAHLEKARGSNAENLKYCSKSDDFITNIADEEGTPQERIKKRILKKYENVIWREWQQEVINIIEEPKDDRRIVWVYDPDGNSGKSYLVKYLALTKNVVIADGKKDNVFNQLLKKSEDLEIDIILMDLPRHNQEYLNYGMLEQLKDGYVYSGKYEGGEIFLEEPHVIVFSNSEPDYSKFTMDRWLIIRP
ncbi:MAG: putative viral replication protein [Cressdnaviricota sp.]|nr:MAG: putative viral replication protein [Cressdnaviricota sp.]